jgi:hypothetical protein
MSLEIKGRLHIVEPITERAASFQTRNFILEIQDDKYPQLAQFQLVQDRCDIVRQGDEGQSVTVHFDIRGREWNGKYITNLQAWKVDGIVRKEKPTTDTLVRAEDSGQSDDLPF